MTQLFNEAKSILLDAPVGPQSLEPHLGGQRRHLWLCLALVNDFKITYNMI